MIGQPCGDKTMPIS